MARTPSSEAVGGGGLFPGLSCTFPGGSMAGRKGSDLDNQAGKGSRR